ncbi:InlB B-repeat-containing protein [Bifidobacterium panos]|uniref:Internalin A n=1 Tax=Bifidobacterium panos TaxID=2675321 RepID=A0ABX1SW16_9BIFI|nr:InlB B-repeat-containing protein [Bifidobacterium sp. DSM 109963]NMN02025.1 internalin A [Bifidobacterium sp. DSM 109963]
MKRIVSRAASRTYSNLSAKLPAKLPAKLLAALLALAMMAVFCPMGSIQAQAAETGILRNKGGVALGASVTNSQVRTITFQNTKPTVASMGEGATCWSAGGGNTATADDSVIGCAIKSNIDSSMYDVVYGADNAYPKFPADSSYLFSAAGGASVERFAGLTEIVGLDKVDTSNAVYMNQMFYGCKKLESLNLSGFKTSNVTDMSQMFYQCEALKSVRVSELFDTSKVTDMHGMFAECVSLESLDVSGFKTSSVMNMEFMFYDCEALKSLVASGWDTSSVTNMSSMFMACMSLKSLDLAKWNTSKVTDMSNMFFYCSSLELLDVSGFDTSKVTDDDSANNVFSALPKLQELRLGANFTLKPSDSGLDNPDTSATREGYTNIQKWRNMTTGDSYDSASGIQAGVAATYTPFEPIEYKVKFEKTVDDATGEMEPQSFTYDKEQALSANAFERVGYTFDKWTTQQDGTGDSYTNEQSVSNLAATAGAEVILYAQWKPNTDTKYTVQHFKQALDGSYPQTPDESETLTGTTGDDTKAAAKSYEGFTAGAVTQQKIAADGTAKVRIEYTRNAYTASFDANGHGTAPAKQSDVKYGAKLTEPAALSADGYAFGGWYMDKACTQAWDFSKSTMPAKNVTLYAKWTVNGYTVKFAANGGAGSMKDQQFAYDAAQNLTANAFTRTGYSFAGWNTKADGKGTAYKDKQSVKNLTAKSGGTVTLYAQWAVNSYTVKFAANGGSGSMKDQRFAYGQAQNLNTNAFARTGYSFAGWNTKADGKGTAYKDKQSVKNLTAKSGDTVTLYAQWTANSYTVKFAANGGFGLMTKQRFTYGQAQNLSANAFRRIGYTFAGWNTKADGKGTAYKDKQSVKNLTAKSGDTVTLYAQWTQTAQLTRLSGNTRYDTMGEIVSQAYTGTAKTVIVASGANYPDALSASGLSGVLDAPIVLTEPNALSSQTVTQLERLKPSKIIIVGGTSAVSEKVASQLKSYASSVTRQGGATRYDTSYLLYEQGGKSWGTTAIVASGAGYADALSVSSYAYAGKAPVFLCDPATGLSAKQRAALAKFKRVVVVGGVQAVPAKYVSGLPGMIRLAGQTRYETSVSVAKWTQKNGLSMDGVVYACGENYPDALVSGPFAGRNKAPVLLVANASSPAVSYSKAFKGKVSNAYVAGGTQVVSKDTANALADALGIRRS